MRVLILGGTGFIGPWVVRQLRVAGHEVAVFHSGRHEPELPAEVEHIHCEAADRPGPWSLSLHGFRGRFETWRPDAVVHMAAMIGEDGLAAAETFDGIAGRIVIVSSVDVYRAYGRLHGSEPGPPEPLPLTEDSLLREQRFPYRGAEARAPDDARRWLDQYDKILVEEACGGRSGLPLTVLRLPMVYGPGDRQHRLYPYLRRMTPDRHGLVIAREEARWLGPRSYVENAAAAVVLAATHPRARGSVYHVSEPSVTEEEWVREIAAAAGWTGRVLAPPRDELPPELRRDVPTEQHLVVDSGRIRRELGYRELVPRTEALRRTVAWEVAHPPEDVDAAWAKVDEVERGYVDALLA